MGRGRRSKETSQHQLWAALAEVDVKPLSKVALGSEFKVEQAIRVACRIDIIPEGVTEVRKKNMT